MNFVVSEGKIILKQSYFNKINDWIEKSDDGSLERQEEIAKQLSEEFEMFSLQGKVTFGFKYCDNKENKLRGRVGKYSGWRTGTRDFKLMPDNKIPKKFSMEQTCIRYYDFGRMSWRSFKRTLFVVCSSFFNSSDGKWYDNPQEAEFKRTWKTKNKLKMRNDRPDTDDEIQKRNLINQKEQEKRERQISLNNKKSNLNKAHQYIDLLKGLETFKSDLVETPIIVLKGCLMLSFECENWYETLSEINLEDVYNNIQDNFGLEFEPHCTILYGFLQEQLNIDELSDYVKNFLLNNTIDLLVEEVSFFENVNYDVLKFNVSSNTLTTLNNNLKTLFEYENSFPDYKPHVTISYLKKGSAQKYMHLVTPILTPKTILYSNPDRQKTRIITL